MRARSYASTLAKTVQLQRHISTSCCLRAQLNLAEKPLTDEYGARPKRLQPLSRDGTVATKKRSATSPLTKTSLRRSAEPIDEQVELEDDTDSQIDSPSAVVASTTFEQSVRANLAKYPDAILLTQVGSFFESYFDQAILVSRTLGIKLTSKFFGKGASKARYPFAGFPLAQLMKHASTLVEGGHKVVVVEEFKPAGDSSALTSRKVTRVITPGTGIDEGLILSGAGVDQAAFVLALGVPDGDTGSIGLAYRDVATGSAFTRTSTVENLRDDILLVEPREIVLDKQAKQSPMGQRVWQVLRGEQEREGIMVSETSTEAVPRLTPIHLETTPNAEAAAEAVLLAYLASTLLTAPPPRVKPTHVDPTRVMQMDSTTLKSLEVKESLRGGLKGSLLSAIKRTATPGGSRLLQERLCAPSTVLDEINERLALVQAFYRLTATRRYFAPLLRSLDDSSRVLQRLYLRRGSPFDLLSLKKTIHAVETVRELLSDSLDRDEIHEKDERSAIEHLLARFSNHGALAQEIERAIDEEALVERTQAEQRRAEIVSALGETQADREDESGGAYTPGLWGRNEPWAVKKDVSPGLKMLHDELVTLRRQAHELEAALTSQYKLPAKALSLKLQPKLGPVVHIASKGTFAEVEKDPKTMMVVKTGSTRSYHLSAWTTLHSKIIRLTAKISKLEDETMKILFARVSESYESLQETMGALDELDVALGFAEAAVEMRLVRPIVDERSSLSIEAGRHPTVESALRVQGRDFTPNSVLFDHPSSFVHVLTGPNMAGKSTFLRQTALITILAQAGSFVPANKVEMGIVDRVFSRVGARDELDRDRSTFMIEMDEATSILKTATENSLVLMDELGRGTSPLDGLAIAFAALEHLVHVNRSRTLFATHYHRLGELLGYDEADPRGKGDWDGIEFWCTDVEEGEDSVTYRHEVRRGLNDDSAGLIIARLSGMPERAVKVATELRNRYR